MTRQHGARHEEGEDPERQVDVEHPAPRQVRDTEAADERPDHGGHGEHGPEEAHIAAAVAGRHDVADDGLRADHQSATTQPLERSEGDQLGHRVAEAGQCRPDHEDDDRRLEEGLPPVLVAELAPQRRRHGRGQEVGGHHPRQVGPPVQVAHDGRQRGRHDGLVERGQQHAEQQCTQDEPQPAARDPLEGRRCRGCDAHTHLPSLLTIDSE